MLYFRTTNALVFLTSVAWLRVTHEVLGKQHEARVRRPAPAACPPWHRAGASRAISSWDTGTSRSLVGDSGEVERRGVWLRHGVRILSVGHCCCSNANKSLRASTSECPKLPFCIVSSSFSAAGCPPLRVTICLGPHRATKMVQPS